MDILHIEYFGVSRKQEKLKPYSYGLKNPLSYVIALTAWAIPIGMLHIMNLTFTLLIEFKKWKTDSLSRGRPQDIHISILVNALYCMTEYMALSLHTL